MNSLSHYSISNLLPADETLLLNDVYLILLHATRIPPHLLISVSGKLFSLGVKGPAVEDDLKMVLKFIRQKQTPTIFIKLSVPMLFTIQDLSNEIRKYTLAYPRVDVGIATCLTPIKDFCSSVYNTEIRKVNFIYELLPKLYEQKAAGNAYHLFLEKHLQQEKFCLPKYSMNDIYEGIRNANSGVTA